ncbi:MAG TPA: LAGLIDADG family homing endonuclease [Nitrososphaerales archaeon]|nr:LAGLIDADG family homing endonuclease [Nitrososphaerales archaeon]
MAEEKDEVRSVGLAWPPTREDLQRLYIEQKLSAARISKVYGLKYARDKTAESTILHHLKKNGVKRRDPAEHVRKVSEEMVDAWVARYQNGESLKQIAEGLVSPVSVFNHLRKRGVQLRDRVEAQIKTVKRFQKFPFQGSEEERAYLLGFTRGDLGVARHGRAIRVKTSSTHPAMIELVLSLFGCYGPSRVYPRYSKMVGYEWSVEAELDQSFEFLLIEKDMPPANGSRKIILSYLAGLFDSEGSVWLWEGRTFAPRVSFTNKDLTMLGWIETRLTQLGFYSARGPPDGRDVSRTSMWRKGEILALIQAMPLRHPEKKAKARLLLGREDLGSEFEVRWYGLLDDIEYDRATFIQLAQSILEARAKVV